MENYTLINYRLIFKTVRQNKVSEVGLSRIIKKETSVVCTCSHLPVSHETVALFLKKQFQVKKKWQS